jgi:hypothetical protein
MLDQIPQSAILYTTIVISLLPFLVQLLKKLKWLNSIDPRRIALSLSVLAGLIYAFSTTFLSAVFLAKLAVIAGLSFTMATFLYRQYKGE